MGNDSCVENGLSGTRVEVGQPAEFISLVSAGDDVDSFSRMVATEIEVDKLGVYFGGRNNRTGLAVGRKGKDDIKNDPEILVCQLCGW